MSGVDEGAASRTVGEVGRLVGVSVRALHHYDEIGLVVPTSRTSSGYRSYTASDVDRLHRVLLYRELGLRLEEIATLLDDPTVDARAHLLRQRELLDERIARLHRMVAAVEEMLEAHTVGTRLSTEEQAEIFGDDWLGEEYSAEAEQRWGGTDAWAQSQRRTAAFTRADWQRVKDETDALEAALAQALRDGVAPGSARANALAEEHRASIDRFHDCDHAMQVCLATMYVTDPRFTAHYDALEPGLAQWLHDAVVAGAAAHGV